MTFMTIFEKARNGMEIKGVVSLVSKEDMKNCWRGEVRIDDAGMAMSHHNSRSEAEEWTVGMHKVYMDVHG